MSLDDLTVRAAILEGGPAASKADLVGELLRVLCDAGHLPHDDIPAIRQTILRREQFDSTGIGRGIAIPHARHGAASRPLGCVGVCRTPVNFDSLDGEPVDLIVLLLSPPSRPGGHLGPPLRDAERLLRRLCDDEFCRRLREAGAVAEIEEVFRAGDGMTRREWHACEDPAAMLRFVTRQGLVSVRKARLREAALAIRMADADILRCLFAPPASEVAIRPEWSAFCDGVVGKLAWGIEEEDDFSQARMGILADALEDAGADAELIEHLRRPEPHARGCFVIDLLTGQG